MLFEALLSHAFPVAHFQETRPDKLAADRGPILAYGRRREWYPDLLITIREASNEGVDLINIDRPGTSGGVA
jgi:hypothetical protein